MGSSAWGPQYQGTVVYNPESESHQYLGNGSRYWCCQRILNRLHNRVVHLMCDNASVVSYIRKEGGTRLFRLTRLMIRLLKRFVIANGLYWYQSICQTSAMFMQTVCHAQDRCSWWSGSLIPSCYVQCSISWDVHESNSLPRSTTRNVSSSCPYFRIRGRPSSTICPSCGTGWARCMPSHYSKSSQQWWPNSDSQWQSPWSL